MAPGNVPSRERAGIFWGQVSRQKRRYGTIFVAAGSPQREARFSRGEGMGEDMLLAEAVIAQLLGALLIGYSGIKHIGGSEGVAFAVLVLALVLLFVVPLTAHYLS